MFSLLVPKANEAARWILSFLSDHNSSGADTTNTGVLLTQDFMVLNGGIVANMFTATGPKHDFDLGIVITAGETSVTVVVGTLIEVDGKPQYAHPVSVESVAGDVSISLFSESDTVHAYVFPDHGPAGEFNSAVDAAKFIVRLADLMA